MADSIHDFFIHVNEDEKHLVIDRKELSRNVLDYIDQEMANGKSKEYISICGADQVCFDYFIEHYGASYRYIELFKCQLISDFSSLKKLDNLERVDIFWNTHTAELWDFSKNKKLKTLRINDCKKLTLSPNFPLNKTSLEEIEFGGDIFNKYQMESLQCFANLPSLKKLELYQIKLADRNISFLDGMENLVQFDFDAGMFTTEEIAHICAKYPHLKGCCLGPYEKTKNKSKEIRICGYRKPTIEIPRQQNLLDKYIKEFNQLVENEKALINAQKCSK